MPHHTLVQCLHSDLRKELDKFYFAASRCGCKQNNAEEGFEFIPLTCCFRADEAYWRGHDFIMYGFFDLVDAESLY